MLAEGAAKRNSSRPGSKPTRAEASLGAEAAPERPQAHASPAGLFLEGRAVVGEPLLAQRTDAGYFKPYR